MHLWTEYEGRTIAEHYTLGKLLRSEGRNGFFATADKDGHPAVIRLTEAHFDEAEQLERWRHVAEVHQDNLIEIEQVGQTTFEGVALTYALMEPDDANLGDVLKERPLTTTETLQVARAVLAALRALHTSGLIHEHVEPVNVLAVGETVKLRSDCVRECVADGEFSTEETCADLRRQDLHDYGTLLLRCLTLETEWVPAHNNLPDPFKKLIPRALDGSWTPDQIAAVLEPAAPAYGSAVSAPAVAGQESRTASAPAAAPQASTASTPIPSRPSSSAEARLLVPPGVRQAATPPNSSGPATALPRRSGSEELEPALPLQARRPALDDDLAGTEPSRTVWFVLAAVALLVLWLGYHFFFGKSATNPVPAPRSATVQAPVVSTPSPTQRRAAPITPAHTTPESPAATSRTSGWYVIAFTYNHEEQAATKVSRLRRTHNSLHPEVFSPSGHGPYLVSLGGAMSSESEAEAVYRHARRAGLPRDTFVRRY